MAKSINGKINRASRVCIVDGKRKRRFRDHKEAIRALHGAKSLQRRELDMFGKSSRLEGRAYFHSHCTGWHLTKQGEHIVLQLFN